MLKKVANFAQKALYYEVALTPKPGLVDRLDNGSHADMNFYTFIESIQALSPFFEQYVEAGFHHDGDLPDLFHKIRKIGVQAEKQMLVATNQINTHKGANFSFAVLLGATGYHLKNHTLPFSKADTKEILYLAQLMTKDIVEEDFANLINKKKLSYGENLYIEHGLTGIRGEAASGFPTLSQILLPYLREKGDKKIEMRLLRALLLLMSQVEDGNIIHRGGLEAWKMVKEESKEILDQDLTDDLFIQALQRYNQTLIKRNLSPGGCADLLALGLYFSFLEEVNN